MPQSKSTRAIRQSLSVKSPSFRYLEVSNFLNKPNYSKRSAVPKEFTELQKLVVAVSRGIPADSPVEVDVTSVEKAVLLDQIPACRALIRGYLISEESLPRIATFIEESPQVIECYSHLFFDPSVFFNLLVKVSYIRSLPTASEEEKFEKQVLSWGHYLGSKYISWKIGAKELSNILPSQAVRRVLDDSIWRSSEHALLDITSAKARESKTWVPQVLKSAELLNTMETTAGMENALSGLKIKLSGVNLVETKTNKELEIKG